MPLPTVVAVVGFVVVVVGIVVVVNRPITPTHTLTSACIPEQSLQTVGSH